MRAGIALMAAVATWGCSEALMSNNSKMTQVCEAYVKQTLRSPSTYERVSAEVLPHASGRDTRIVVIEYDAANAFGTPVRDKIDCPVPVDPKTGKVKRDASIEALATVVGVNIDLQRLKHATEKLEALEP